MNLQDLRYLVAVAEHRHFGKAAEASFVTQPTLSTQLKKLERELGVELIERNPRQIMLTAAGEQVAERARVMLAEADDIRRIAQRAQDPESGTLRMGLFPTLAPYLLPHVVPSVHRRFPNLELLLIEDKTEAVLRGLREGRMDIGVLAQPVRDSHLVERFLFAEDFVLAVPSSHPLATAHEPVSMAVLAGENVLLLEEGHCLREQALSVCQLAGASEHNGFRATSLETLRQMVAAGVGITLLPELAVAAPVPASPNITLLRFADPAPSRRIAMYWRETSVFAGLINQMAAEISALTHDLIGVHAAP